MSGPEVAKTPGGGAPGKEGKEPVANGHSGEANDVNPFAEYMWMENEEEYNRQVSSLSVPSVANGRSCWSHTGPSRPGKQDNVYTSGFLF